MNKKFMGGLLFSLSAGLVWLYASTPGHLKTPQGIEEKITFVDRRGLPIRAYSPHESFEWMKLQDVPQDFKDLLILAEDRHFFEHSGLDVPGIFRSMLLNLKHLRVVSGASTIDQQVYRMAHHLPRNFWGKIRTMIGAYKINLHYSKNQIFQTYLNTLPFGKRVTGIKRGAFTLFGKDLALLSLSEMATLAILPRAPSLLSQDKSSPYLHRRKNILLTEYLSKDREQLELEKKITVKFQRNFTGWDNYHFVSKLLKRSDFNQFIHQGVVKTTLDSYLQQEVSGILHAQLDQLKDLKVTHGAVVVVDSQSGDVLSYVGSQAISESRTGFIDALEVRRQPGSALKPLTYALALQKGKTLGDVLPDIPSFYKTGGGQFLPRNYDQDFSGPRLMREALANSLNLPAVALADELGVQELYQFYQKVGLDLNQEASHYGVGITLGNVEITPLNLAQCYTSFANLGTRTNLRYFEEEKIIHSETPLLPQTAYLISDVLSDPVARREEFGEHNPFDLPFEFSVKTGTSTDFRDNWAVGYNPLYTVVVWVGNMNQEPMKKVSGITGAGPVLSQVASYLMKQKYHARQTAPEGIERHEICALSGKTPGPHCQHKKSESFLKGSYPDLPCPYHQEVVVHDCHETGDLKKVKVALLPDQYQAFIDKKPQWSIEGQVSRVCQEREFRVEMKSVTSLGKVAIQRPLPGSVYALDPNLPQRLQMLKLELNHIQDVRKVVWKKDGVSFKGSKAMADWPLEQGEHHFEAEVTFQDGRVEKTPLLDVTVL